MPRESQLVEKIARALAPHRAASSRLKIGIGDDAAIVSHAARTEWALSCDTFLENVHFRLKTHPPDSVGYKALARAARELGITVIGGDTTKSDRILISITVLGEIAPGRALTRSGARPGDIIYVSCKLGCAQLGLEIVLRGQARNRQLRALVQPHLYPKIRIELGSWLAQHRIATSAMDLSDGLSTDLARLCTASQVGAKIYASKVPTATIPPQAARKLGQRKLDPLQLALHGGEDYELLFTIPPRQAKKLSQAPGASTLTAIGEITRNRELILVANDGREKPLKSHGWDPFR